MKPSLRDDRGLITSLFIQAILIFTVIGLALYEGGQVLVAQIKAKDVAATAAQAGVEDYSRSKDVRQAQTVALEAAQEKDPNTRVTGVGVGGDGSVVVSTVKTATTIIIKRVSFLRRFGIRRSTVREEPLPP
jgi:Flp pilus assembly protein TadG